MINLKKVKSETLSCSGASHSDSEGLAINQDNTLEPVNNEYYDQEKLEQLLEFPHIKSEIESEKNKVIENGEQKIHFTRSVRAKLRGDYKRKRYNDTPSDRELDLLLKKEILEENPKPKMKQKSKVTKVQSKCSKVKQMRHECVNNIPKVLLTDLKFELRQVIRRELEQERKKYQLEKGTSTNTLSTNVIRPSPLHNYSPLKTNATSRTHQLVSPKTQNAKELNSIWPMHRVQNLTTFHTEDCYKHIVKLNRDIELYDSENLYILIDKVNSKVCIVQKVGDKGSSLRAKHLFCNRRLLSDFLFSSALLYVATENKLGNDRFFSFTSEGCYIHFLEILPDIEEYSNQLAIMFVPIPLGKSGETFLTNSSQLIKLTVNDFRFVYTLLYKYFFSTETCLHVVNKCRCAQVNVFVDMIDSD